MRFIFREMTEKDARKVAAWKYEPPYDFYDLANEPEDLTEILDPEKRQNYYSAIPDGELVGYLCFGAEARVPGGDYENEALDIGLGMRPDLTGRGLGLDFLLSGLEFAGKRFSTDLFRLSVAEFNERAITVYKRAGFRRVQSFTRRTNDSEVRFVIMTRET